MRGRIVVQAAPQPTEPSGDGAGAPTPTLAPGTTPAAPPTTGFGPDGGSSSWWLLALVAGAGVALLSAGAFAFRRAREM